MMRTQFSKEAQNITYQSGIRQLAPLVDRIRALEALVAGLTARLESLEQAQSKSVPPLLEREVR
jgi:hypothetical protein